MTTTAALASVRISAQPEAVSLDEAMHRSAASRDRAPYVQDALAVNLNEWRDAEEFGPQHTQRALLPDPEQWAAQIGQAIVEVMSGLRTPPQVLRWCTPPVYAVIARRGAIAARRRVRQRRSPIPRAQVRRVRVCEPADGVAECILVVNEGQRVRAMAMRLVGQDGRWRVDALDIG